MMILQLAGKPQSKLQKEVTQLKPDFATTVIGIAMLMIAFATLVIKIIEVARST